MKLKICFQTCFGAYLSWKTVSKHVSGWTTTLKLVFEQKHVSEHISAWKLIRKCFKTKHVLQWKKKENMLQNKIPFLDIFQDFFRFRVLMLHVIRANNLPVEDKGTTVDPYVKMYLLPERRGHCKTRICKKSNDPEFNEMFSFDVSFNNLANRMLQVSCKCAPPNSNLFQFTVYDFDRFTRHGLIGNIIMRDLFEKSDLYTWTEYTMHIVASQNKNDYGDLLLFLTYSHQEEKLSINVSKAYNLRPMDITGASGRRAATRPQRMCSLQILM